MSRTIDMENKDAWTDDEIIYLRDRNRLPDGYELPDDLKTGSPTGASLDEQPYVGDIGTFPESDDTAFGSIVEDDDDYSAMTRAQLQAEARARNLDDSGNKGDLIARIQSADIQGG